MNSLLPSRHDGVVLLTYHLVGAGTGAAVDISIEMFREHLAQLKPHVVTLDDALAHLTNDAPGTRVVITFDDAFLNFCEIAWPALVEVNVPVMLYVPTDFVDGCAPAPLRGADSLPACSWEQLREMASTGLLSIGSHTCSHRDLSRLSVAETRIELIESKHRLEAELGQPVTSFCYPGGRVSPSAAEAVHATYSTAVVRGGRKLYAGRWSPWSLERVPIRYDSPANVGRLLESSIWIEEWVATRAGLARDRVCRSFRSTATAELQEGGSDGAG